MYKWLLIDTLLFLALVPGVLVTLPPHSSKMTVLGVHALVFALIHYLLKHHVLRETFENPDSRVNPPCPPNSVPNAHGDCKVYSDIYGLK